MVTRRRRWLRLAPAAGWGVVAVMLGLGTASGQSISVDPYDPWNAMYRPFIFPTAPLNPAMPGQGRFDESGRMIRGQNEFGRYLDSVGVGVGDPFGRNRGSGSRTTPYYMSTRPRGGVYDRSYMANRDDTFYEDLQKREEAYRDASMIRDPKKRAEAIRKLERESARAARSGTAGRNARRPSAELERRAAPGALLPGASTEPRRPGDPEAGGGLLGRGLLRDSPIPSRSGFSNSETLRRSRAMTRARRAAAAAGPATSPSDDSSGNTTNSPPVALPDGAPPGP